MTLCKRCDAAGGRIAHSKVGSRRGLTDLRLEIGFRPENI
jgi:hypothetical protein